MLYERATFRIGCKVGVLLTGAIWACAYEVPASTTAPDNSGPSIAPIIISGRQNARPAGTYSTGVTELIKMLDAKVDAQVILAFIQNSPIPYNPDATELIALAEHGASTEVLTAILHHGDELRLRLAQAQSEVNPSPAVPAYEAMPSAEIPPSPYGSPVSDEVPYPTTYYAYTYWWPWMGHAPVCNSYRPYLYERGCWVPPRALGHYSGEVSHNPLAAPHLTHSFSAPASGHTHAWADRASGAPRSAGRSTGRSR